MRVNITDVPLVGLMGRKRAGKDSVAEGLAIHAAFLRYAFAARLKEALLALDPIVSDGLRLSNFVAILGWEGAKTIPEVRRLMQYYGDSARMLDPDIFVRATMPKVERALADGYSVVVTDVRRKNEAEAIRRAGGVLVRVVRPGADDGDTHISETECDEVEADAEIVNDGALADLAARTLSTTVETVPRRYILGYPAEAHDSYATRGRLART